MKDFEGNTQQVTSPSPAFSTYLQNQSAYYAAVSAYRTAFNNYDMTKPADQRQWQANAPLLQANVDSAWNTFRSGNASMIEQAIAAMDTSVNSAVRSVLENDRKVYSTTSLASNITGAPNWHLSYALPTNWCVPTGAKNFSHLVINSGSLNKTASSQYTSYGAGASWSWGLWSVGGGTSGSSSESHYHMDSNDFSLALDIGVVQIRRPWLDGQIFSMGGWSLGDAYLPNSISTGNLSTNAGKMMPLITTGMIVARNVQIKCNFSTQDQSHVESAVSGSTSVGWGPFSLSGHYSHSSSKDTFNSTYSNGTLTIPGLQVIGFVNWIVPACPPVTTTAKVAAKQKAASK